MTQKLREDGMPYATVNDAKIHYALSGAGEPILLIPGLGLDHNYYRLATPTFARAMTVYAIDPRGIGESTKSRPPYSVEAWADDFAALIEGLGQGPIHVLGTSLGGAMALALAVRAPELVKTLTVVGAFSELDRAAVLNFGLRSRLIEHLGMSEEVADYMGLWTMSREFVNSDDGYAQMKANQAIIKRNSADLYLAFVQSVLAWARCLPGQEHEAKFTGELAKIRARTLVIGSANDQLIPLRLSEKIAENIPGAKLHVMPDGGHIPFVEKPEEVTRIVLDFIGVREREPA
jgi:pimeloyl-ACP methyl ester carboxylesterase